LRKEEYKNRGGTEKRRGRVMEEEEEGTEEHEG
jgi:hypothetical protein